MAQKARTRQAKTQGKTITPEQFVLTAIQTLREGTYKGIHTVYSGFNEAFRLKFPELDPIAVTKQMAATGQIEVRVVRGGAIIYLKGDAPAIASKGADVLKRMGL